MSYTDNDPDSFARFAAQIKNETENGKSVYLLHNTLPFIPRAAFEQYVLPFVNVSLAFEMESEDYHAADIRFTKYVQRVYRLTRK